MQSAADPPAGAGHWVSSAEAQRLLRMSEGTLRRSIRDGSVRAELRRRNPSSPTDQRMVYEVWVPEPPAADVVPESPSVETAATEPPAATTRALEILAAALEAERAERQQLATELRAESAARAAAEARAEALQDALDQWAIDCGQQTERAIRAETERDLLQAEVMRWRKRRWWNPKTW